MVESDPDFALDVSREIEQPARRGKRIVDRELVGAGHAIDTEVGGARRPRGPISGQHVGRVHAELRIVRTPH
jgi:hypothetical protein